MNKKDKIFIAGHRGLVGSAIMKKLKAEGFLNIITRNREELDLTRQSDVEAFFETERPNAVFMAAARVGGILANSTYPAEFIYDNMQIATNIINASHKTGVDKILNLASSCIYPKFAPQPLKEEDLLTGAIEPTNEPYAVAKIAAIKLCRYYNDQYGTNYISAMPASLYGPGDNYNLQISHVLPALIRKFHLARLLSEENFDEIARNMAAIDDRQISGKDEIIEILSGLGITTGSVTIWGTGEPLREFLYVNDLADAVLFLMQGHDYTDIGEFINIGAGKDISIKDLAHMVMEIVSYDGALKHDLTKPDGTPRKLLDSSRLTALGWSPTVGIRDGITMAYEDYLKSVK